MFTLVINHTQELNGFKNANTGNAVIYLTEEQLNDVLKGKQVGRETTVDKGNIKYRY